jgi:hypothetical protein
VSATRANLALTATTELAFDSLARECAVQSLADLLGKSAAAAILRQVPISDVTRAPEAFHSHLYSIFRADSLTIEHIILLGLYRKLGAQFVERNGAIFAEDMHEAMQLYAKEIVEQAA